MTKQNKRPPPSKKKTKKQNAIDILPDAYSENWINLIMEDLTE